MKKTILLADDDDAVRHTLGRVLQSEQYEVLLARTGREAATQFLHIGPPDLVLLDLNMPDKDGWEAFHLISQLDQLVPVIIITARPRQHEKAVELGVDALMEKPLDLPLLLSTIKDLLAESGKARVERLTNPAVATEFPVRRARELAQGGEA